jgi:hypothetical protein
VVAARTGAYGALLNDNGVGVPGVEQKLVPPPTVLGKTISATAWVRLVSFPGMRLLLEANSASNIHLALNFSDTDASNPNWQRLSAQLTIPSTTDHVMVKVTSTVATADGITYVDDVQICMDGMCSPCPSP